MNAQRTKCVWPFAVLQEKFWPTVKRFEKDTIRSKLGLINNYEEEIVHDILYHARGKGYITESEIVDLAYPMIMGFKERNETDCSELNFLQSYQIFPSCILLLR